MTFAEWLNQTLYERGWSQSEAARRSGLSASAIQQVAGGVTKAGPRLCRGLARAFGMDPEEVFRLADLLPSPSPGRVGEQTEGYLVGKPADGERLARLFEEMGKLDRALLLQLAERLAYRINPRIIGEGEKA